MAIRVCKKCVLDETASELTFDDQGVCNFCREYENVKIKLNEFHQNTDQYFKELKKKLKKEAGGPYDSILGLSGGVDSSYVALVAKRYGLNPLLVHFDNGWNSEVSVSNIKKIVKTCGFDLHTYVINWPEFRDLQRSFFKASVLDIEMLTDHAIMAVLFQLSRKFKTRNVLSGNNWATEFGMPSSWSWNKKDFTNIKAIHKKYGTVKLKTFPVLSTWKWLAIKKFGYGMNFIEVLNHLPYNKSKAMKELKQEFDWVYYGGKHYESTFTKFYQAYYLPEKFGIDKRKAHWSSLIRNGEIDRDDAMEEVNKPIYDPDELRRDKEFVLKKLGFSEQEFEEIMKTPPIPHQSYPSDHNLFNTLQKIYRTFKRA